MKKIGKALFLSTAMASIIGVAAINTIDSSDKLVQFIAPQADSNVVTVSTWDEFEAAIEDTTAAPRTIVLENDIDLSGFTPTDDLDDEDNDIANYQGGPYSIEIDGDGHSFYNKPPEYFFTPLIFFGFDPSSLYIHDLTFDNAGYLFASDANSSSVDYGDNGVNIDETNSIYFQDITVKNIDLEDQTWTLDPDAAPLYASSAYGLLFGDVILNEVSGSTTDNALTLSDITIEDNTISNNELIFKDNTQASFSFSPLGNLSYIICSQTDHHHQGFLDLNNIQIKNNQFTNNTVNSTNTNLVFSYGNVLGSFDGLEDITSTGTDGNFLNISNILVENNVIEAPNGIAPENFIYSEMISNPIAVSDQQTSIVNIKNFYSINNVIFGTVEESKILYNQEDIISINMFDVGNTGWVSNESNSMMFIGPNYNNPEASINVVAGGVTKVNDIYHDQVLATSQTKFSTLNSNLSNSLGIYGYDLATRSGSQLNDEFGQYGSNLNPNENYLTTISLSSIEDQALIFNWDSDRSNNLIYNLQIDFKYLQKITIGNTPITTPYVLNNVTLSEGTLDQEKILGVDNQSLTTSGEKNYIYTATFEWSNGLDISSIDLNNLYLSFEYEDGLTKETKEASIKLDSNDIIESNATNISNNNHSKDSSAAVIASTTSIAVVVVIALLVLFILKFRKKRQGNNNVQDEYYQDPQEEYQEYEEYQDYGSKEIEFYGDQSEYYEEVEYQEDEYSDQTNDYYESEEYVQEDEYSDQSNDYYESEEYVQEDEYSDQANDYYESEEYSQEYVQEDEYSN